MWTWGERSYKFNENRDFPASRPQAGEFVGNPLFWCIPAKKKGIISLNFPIGSETQYQSRRGSFPGWNSDLDTGL